jgi:predicted SAM-dependent methyltransferase
MVTMPTALQELAGRIPRRWRRLVPTRLRNSVVKRFGHPAEPFDPAAYPRRLNLGAGFDNRPGYLNVDFQAFHQPDLVGDVRRLPELPSGGYDEIIAQDVLEHFERADGPPALAEWRRLLAPGGRLWLRVPDLPSLLRELEAKDGADQQREVLHRLFGTQAYQGDFHLNGFTDVVLCDELQRVGLERIELEMRDGWLWEGEAFAPDGRPRPPVAFAWGVGFHRREVGADGAGWRWAGREAELLLYAAEPLDVALEWDVMKGSGRVEASTTLEFSPGRQCLELSLRAGANRVRFHSAGAPAGGDDPRDLALQLAAGVTIRPAKSGAPLV